jgi:hypothetical protein
MWMSFDLNHYHQQNKVETVFFVLVRTCGESLKSRKYWIHIKEIKPELRMI